jgi:hypothetical protein
MEDLNQEKYPKCPKWTAEGFKEDVIKNLDKFIDGKEFITLEDALEYWSVLYTLEEPVELWSNCQKEEVFINN